MKMLLFALLQLCRLSIGESLGHGGEMNVEAEGEAKRPLSAEQGTWTWSAITPLVTRQTPKMSSPNFPRFTEQSSWNFPGIAPLVTRQTPKMTMPYFSRTTSAVTSFATHTTTIREPPQVITIHSTRWITLSTTRYITP